MRKEIINIPSGIKYLSEFKGFELPNGIFNKVLTGCGATTIAIMDEYPTIICSPRKKLIESKVGQHSNIFWFKNDTLKNEIEKYLNSVKVPKIMVTYDSLYKLNKYVDFNTYRIVVDEFQRLLTDSSFKGETEMKVISNLSKYNYVTYLSATPILEKYLDKIELFNDITYYEAKWEETDNVLIKLIKSPNPKQALLRFITAYKNEEFITCNECISKEIVFYINSVSDIVNAIKTANLTPEECNIICGDTNDNKKLISKIGAGFKMGTLPKKGDKHCMFTFCTSTAYDGVDMYSDNAISIVITDYKMNNLLMNISVDLVQIAGRQRMETNPFNNTVVLVFSEGMDIESLNQYREDIKLKLITTEIEIEEDNNSKIFEKRISDWGKMPSTIKFTTSYKTVENGKFVFGNMIYLNECYKIDVCEDFLKNGIKKVINKNTRLQQIGSEEWIVFTEKIKMTIERTEFTEGLKTYCELKEKGNDSLILFMDNKNPDYIKYYNLLGPDKCRALSYQRSKLDNFIINSNKIVNKDEAFKLIYNKLSNGFISSKDLKVILTDAYKKSNISLTAKAKDILECNFIEVRNNKEISKRIDGKVINGFEIIKK